MKTLRKLTAILLSLVLLISFIPESTVSAEDLPEIMNPFTDVKEGKYFHDPVLWALDNHITTGTSPTTFSPNEFCTRAQIVTFLWRTAGSPEPSTSENPFKDVKEGKFYYKAVLWAVENEITTGIAPDTFGTNDSCTRAQAVTFLYRAAGSPSHEAETNPFTDVKKGKFYYDPVLWALENEITTGTSPTEFSPNDFCTRGQIVTLLHRAVMNLSGKEEPQEEEDNGEKTIFSVTELELSGSEVLATINVNSKATLHIEFLDENGEAVLFDTSAETPDYCEMEEVAVPFTGTLPEFFLIRGVLLDEEGKELCQPYTALQYTSAHKEFEDKDIEDFEGSLVINFDDDMTTNFGVLAPDVKVVETEAGKNILTLLFDEVKNEEGTITDYIFTGYHVENPDEQIRSLKAGDVAAMEDKDGYLQIFKIGGITENQDGSILFAGSDEVDITEYYDYIDLDITFGGESEDSGNQTVTIFEVNGNEYGKSSNHDYTDKFKLAQKIKFHAGFFFAEGEVSENITVELKIHYDSLLSVLTDKYLDFTLKSTSSFKASFKMGVTNDYESADGKPHNQLVNFELASPLCLMAYGFKIQPKAAFSVEFTGKISVGIEYEAKSTSGFKYVYATNTREDFEEKKTSFDFKAEGEFEVKCTPEVKLEISFLEKVVKATLSAGVGIKAKGTAEYNMNFSKNVFASFDEAEKHGCTLCVDVKAGWFTEAKASLKFCIIENKLDFTVFDLTLFNLEGEIGVFYISIINDKDSMFGGKLHAGVGKCPNKQYRTKVRVKDAKGAVLTGGELYINDEAGNKKSSGEATLKEYLYNGTYTAGGVIELNGSAFNLAPVQFTVENNAVNVDLEAVKMFVISFLPNGGTGTMNPVTIVTSDPEAEYKLPDCGFKAPEYHEFKAWEVNGKEYAPGDTIIIKGGTEVTALWKSNYPRYKVFNLSLSWDEACAYCESLGGHMATITSAEENEEVYQAMISQGYTSAYFGFTDRASEGTWVWVTGEPVQYTNWQKGEPNNQGNKEHYGMYYYKNNGSTWNDGDYSGSPVSFICEWDTAESYYAYLQMTEK